ncbi:MAG: hypothetical protein E7184_03620 [Erysipelotrichaceae bacterium]|nr:hypothetical protein [Erysipelotrichaceae bacterium]
MIRNRKFGIVSFFLVIFSAFLIMVLEGKTSNAMDSSKLITSKVNVSVQVNDGNRYFVDPYKIKVEVDASANSDVNMFSVVICSNDTGVCSPLDAKYRYTDLENGKYTLTASLEWIKDTSKNFVIEEGSYSIKVKPEKQSCFIICSPIFDIIEEKDESLRYIETVVDYIPLNSSDLEIKYNNVPLSNEQTTTLSKTVFDVQVNRFDQVYGETVKSLYYKYCLANNEWSTSWTDSSVNCKNGNLTLEEGIAPIDLQKDKLEGNYILTVIAETTFGRQFSKSIRFTFDDTAPRVTISKADEVITKTKTFTFTAIDNSTTKTKFLVKDALADAPVETDFKEFATANTVEIKDLSGEYILWLCTTDDSGNSTIVSSEKFQMDNSAPIIENLDCYVDFYNKKLVIQISKVSDQIKENITYFASTDGINYTEYTSNLIKVDISELIGSEIKVYLYAKDSLGNFDQEKAKQIVPIIEESDIEIRIDNATENNYYNEEVSFTVMGSDVISIKVNSFEYINNRFFCSPIMEEGEQNKILGYTCKFSTDGVHNVIVTNASESTNSINFIIDKDGIWNIDGDDKNVEEMFIVKVVAEGDKFYGSLPLSVYDLKKDIKLVYLNKQNKYQYVTLLEGKETVPLNEIEGPGKFLLPIDLMAYQNANELSGTGEVYFLAYSVIVDRVDNNVVVETPEEPKEELPNQNESHPVGNITETDDGFSIKDIFTFKNVLMVSIIVITIIYVIRFFVYKKNIQTV